MKVMVVVVVVVFFFSVRGRRVVCFGVSVVRIGVYVAGVVVVVVVIVAAAVAVVAVVVVVVVSLVHICGGGGRGYCGFVCVPDAEEEDDVVAVVDLFL